MANPIINSKQKQIRIQEDMSAIIMGRKTVFVSIFEHVYYITYSLQIYSLLIYKDSLKRKGVDLQAIRVLPFQVR